MCGKRGPLSKGLSNAQQTPENKALDIDWCSSILLPFHDRLYASNNHTSKDPHRVNGKDEKKLEEITNVPTQ